MEKRICVRIRVSDDEHAEKIRNEIERVVRHRTTIYHVGIPHLNKITIEQIGNAFCNGLGGEVAPDEV